MVLLHGLGKLSFCTIFSFFLGGNEIYYSVAPHGRCSKCCPLVEKSDIRFLLYTKNNPEVGVRLTIGDVAAVESSFLNASVPTVIFLHGFSERAPGPSSIEIRDAYLERGIYNVILVDWKTLAALPWYATAVTNGSHVGRYLARFIRFLMRAGGVTSPSVHVIGFSLGAAAAGVAGRTLKEWGITIGRITGLDPAFPLYQFKSPKDRLGPDAAAFVDVIHTDGGVFGYLGPQGHADFYPNGGVSLQPGCSARDLVNQKLLNRLLGCSHVRAWRLYVESVRHPEAFPAPCPKCAPGVRAFMGESADSRLLGKFYLTTRSRSPYGKYVL